MKCKLYRLLALSAVFALTLAATASAQDFQKSYKVGAGGQVRIGNISGDVSVTGYDGDQIIVKGYKTGRDSEMVEVEDRSGGGNVDIGVRYPNQCNCDASVRFEVQVPRSISFNLDRISSVSGSVKVSDVAGRISASSVSGDVAVRGASGSVSASSVSGDVNVDINRLEGEDDMKFSSVSGSVHVKAPSHLAADVDMSSFSGSVKTDFGLEVHEGRQGMRRWARGRIGDGGTRRLKMSSVSGDLSLQQN
jgi:DUF4097 and DUF4098 domain-containing protein YvlB